MDPTPEQLKGLDTLEQLLDFSGVTLPLRSSVLEALGDPTSVREVFFVSPGDLEVLNTLRVPRPVTEGEESTGPSIPVSPVQKGVRFLLRVARLRAGLPVEGVSHQVTADTIPKVGVVAHPTKRVKLSSLVDSTAGAELVTLEGSEIRQMFSDYKRARGDYPHKDMEPSGEQLSAVAQLLKTGQAPYVDFALPLQQEGTQEAHAGVVLVPGRGRHLEEGRASGPPGLQLLVEGLAGPQDHLAPPAERGLGAPRALRGVHPPAG